MQTSRILSLRSTLLAAALVLAVGSASAQTESPVKSREPFLNRRIEAAAKPYRDKPSRPAESLALFEALNAESSNDPDVQSWLGFLYLQTGSPERAVAPLELAARNRPDNLEVQINLGNAYLMSRMPQYDKALASYTKVSAGRPSMWEPHYNSGVIYLQRHDYPKAIVELKKAEALEPNNAYVENDLGVAYEKSKDEDGAATAFRSASRISPDEKTFARNAGLAILKLKPTDQNRTAIEKEATSYLEKADQNDPAVALALANMIKFSDKPKALALCDVAEKNLTNPLYVNDLGTYWFNIGAIREVAGDTAGGVRAYEHARALRPNDPEIVKDLALLHLRRKEYAPAETLFDQLTGLTPGSFDTWHYLGEAAAGAGDDPKALVAYREAARLGDGQSVKDLVAVRLGIADGLYRNRKDNKDNVAAAAAEYNRVLALQKNNAQAYNGLGLIYLDALKYAQAQAVLNSAIQADPKYVAAYNNLAIALDGLFRRKEAIAALEKAFSINPNDKNVNDNLQKLRRAQRSP